MKKVLIVVSLKITNLSGPSYEFKLNRFSEFELGVDKNNYSSQSNIDKELVINTVLNMPLEGNNEGLIPAFNVYLAHTPQDFYNIVSMKFIQAMDKIGLKEVAADMLTEDAENCALNTFGGILDSEEWAALVKPMIKNETDVMYGLVAVANALGWGRISIDELSAYESMVLTSLNGYEAFGHIEFKKYSSDAQCFMLKGVSAGLMSLVYGKGDYEDRSGEYKSEERLCLVKKDHVCSFLVNLNE